MSDDQPVVDVPPTDAAPTEPAPAEVPAVADSSAEPSGSPPPTALKSSGSRGSVALGGGGFSCSICAKVSFPAETVMFETKPYHAECFRCSKCTKKMEGGAQAASFENVIYCRQCFEREGLHLKQRQVKWTPKTSAAKTPSRFGGGGTQCHVCGKTAYAGETIQFELKPYHTGCFKCTDCSKDLKPAETGKYEDKIYCMRCFEKNNFHRKQAEVKWTPKAAGSSGPAASRFGGGGTPCTACNLTVYASEGVSYDTKVYHAKCLACSECKKECKQSEVAKYEEKLYCQRCFEKNGLHLKQAQVKFQPKAASTSAAPSRFGGGGSKCVVCAKTVYPAETVQYEGRAYHSKCFQCVTCSKELTPSGAEHNDGKVYCKKCFMEAGLHMARVKPTTAGTESS